MSKPPKIVRWIGSSRQELQELPKAVRQFVGQALWEAQQGKMPEDGKVLRGFGGANVVEIRANDIGGTYRAIYTIRFRDSVYVLLVFKKKSTKAIKTPPHIMELVRKRLKIAENDYEQRKTKKQSGND
jgi:phage-related protein